jgi:hypothetical protein
MVAPRARMVKLQGAELTICSNTANLMRQMENLDARQVDTLRTNHYVKYREYESRSRAQFQTRQLQDSY